MKTCECKCECTPAQRWGLKLKETVVQLVSNNMRDYNLGRDQLAVMVEDDGSYNPKFQRLENFLSGDDHSGCNRVRGCAFLSIYNYLSEDPNPRMIIRGTIKKENN